MANIVPKARLASSGANMPISRKNGTKSNPNSRYSTPRNFADCPIEKRLISEPHRPPWLTSYDAIDDQLTLERRTVTLTSCGVWMLASSA